MPDDLPSPRRFLLPCHAPLPTCNTFHARQTQNSAKRHFSTFLPSPNSFANPVFPLDTAHFNYIGGNGANPLVLSLVQLDKRKDVYGYSVLLRTKKDEYIHSFTAKDKKAALKKTLESMPELEDINGELELVKDPRLSEELAHMEDRMLIKAYRIGVVYAGLSVEENVMFGNNEPSDGFKAFMGWLGKYVKLKGYKGFRGGLDVEHNTTGSHSYTTDAHGFDIMFHVSTELPHTDKNPQQVERKRHIGNDVVVIIYQDGPTAKPFCATSITSKFNHVYIVVQAVPSAAEAGSGSTSLSGATKRKNSRSKNSKRNVVEVEDTSHHQHHHTSHAGSLKYRVAVVSKHGVHCHGPALPGPDHVWSLDDTFRQFLLTKIVNAERAAYYAPGFGQARTRRLWLKSLLEKYSSTAKTDATTTDG